jgi:hypothetical protein
MESNVIRFGMAIIGCLIICGNAFAQPKPSSFPGLPPGGCTYHNVPYSNGAMICVGPGYGQVCKDGKWSDLLPMALPLLEVAILRNLVGAPPRFLLPTNEPTKRPPRLAASFLSFGRQRSRLGSLIGLGRLAIYWMRRCLLLRQHLPRLRRIGGGGSG